jgi:hypothetical protein
MTNGPIPKGMMACHQCDNPGCVRPSHIFIGTASDNMRDMGQKGRHRIGNRKGMKHPLAKFTDEQVREIRKLYKPYSHDFNQYKIAEMFNVSRSSIGLIVTRKEWAHI